MNKIFMMLAFYQVEGLVVIVPVILSFARCYRGLCQAIFLSLPLMYYCHITGSRKPLLRCDGRVIIPKNN